MTLTAAVVVFTLALGSAVAHAAHGIQFGLIALGFLLVGLTHLKEDS